MGSCPRLHRGVRARRDQPAAVGVDHCRLPFTGHAGRAVARGKDKQRDYLRMLQKTGANLLDLINNILDLSKVESGHLVTESIGFEPRALLEKIVETMAPRARDRGLNLTLEVCREFRRHW